jgi:hypothetical protein
VPGLSQSLKSTNAAQECESEDDTDLKDILAQRAKHPRQSGGEAPVAVQPQAASAANQSLASTSVAGTTNRRNVGLGDHRRSVTASWDVEYNRSILVNDSQARIGGIGWDNMDRRFRTGFPDRNQPLAEEPRALAGNVQDCHNYDNSPSSSDPVGTGLNTDRRFHSHDQFPVEERANDDSSSSFDADGAGLGWRDMDRRFLDRNQLEGRRALTGNIQDRFYPTITGHSNVALEERQASQPQTINARPSLVREMSPESSLTSGEENLEPPAPSQPASKKSKKKAVPSKQTGKEVAAVRRLTRHR